MLAHVPSLIQAVFVEMLGAFFVAMLVATLAAHRGVIGCPGDPEIALGFTQIGLGALGIVMVGWILWRIFWPTAVRHSVYHQLRVGLGDLRITIPTGKAGEIDFPSTHPAYALYEAVLFSFVLIVPFASLGTRTEFVPCSLQYSFVLWWTFAVLLYAFPLLRVLAWHVMRRRYGPATKAASEIARKVVVLPFSLTTAVAAVLFSSVLLPELWAPRLDALSFTGGLARHPQRDGQTLHVRGTLAEAPRGCGCEAGRPLACRAADARIELGNGGDVIVRGASDYARKALMLADAGIGGSVSAYGDLSRSPPARQSFGGDTCVGDPFPRETGRPRAYLTIR